MSFCSGRHPGRHPPARRFVEFREPLPHLLEQLQRLHLPGLIHRLLLSLETRRPRPSRGGACACVFSARATPPQRGGESKSREATRRSLSHGPRRDGATHRGRCRSVSAARYHTPGTSRRPAPDRALTGQSAASAASSALRACAPGTLVRFPPPWERLILVGIS